MATTTAVKINDKKQDLSNWVQTYTLVIILLGVLILISAIANPPQDLWGLFLFASLAAISELTNVELFRSSHANVSVSMIIAIASIAVFGPYGAVFVQMVAGVATGFKVAFNQKKEQAGKRASLLRRSFFNVGMFLTAAFVAGWVYVSAGGTVGQIEFPADFLPLFLAAAAYVIVNLILLITVIILQTGRRLVEIWDQDFSWGVPIHILGGVLVGGALAFAYEAFSFLGLLVFFLPVLMTSYSFRLYTNNMRSVVDRLEEVNRDLDEANIGLLHTLGAVIDAYDVYTYGHSTQVAIYAKAIAEKLGRPKEELDLMFKAGLIHDLGKIGITDTIISKEGPLTEEEYNIVKRHTLIGADIIGQMKGLHELVPLVKHHHEHWDGGGYPDGLAGETIPLGARILTLADSLDTMFSDRPYHQTRSFNEVLDEVRRCSGTHFDPQVVAAFMALAQERGNVFFKNSATAVDKFIDGKGDENFSHRLRYMKKSMVADR